MLASIVIETEDTLRAVLPVEHTMPRTRTTISTRTSPTEASPSFIELDNGLRVLHKPNTATRLVHIGVLLNVGSRDEAPHQLGMAHFLEHMLFKGTTHRKAFHILSRIDAVGGELNAFTTKEKTTYHATVMAEHLGRALELLADITGNSTFPAHELEKEISVISEEIDMYRDDPEESIFEDFDALFFAGHALGHPITGTKETIAEFTPAAVRSFVQEHVSKERLVLSISGNATVAEVERLTSRHFGQLQLPSGPINRQAPSVAVPSPLTTPRSINQTHLILGGTGYAYDHPFHLPFLLLTNYLGGPSMNSRLVLNIRERYGLTYNIQSFYQPFTDSGIWGIYAATEPKSAKRVLSLIRKEFDLLLKAPLSSTTLAAIKKQFIGSLVIGNESLFNQMLSQGRDLLDFGRVIPLDEIIRQIERISPEVLHQVARERLSETVLTLLEYSKD